MPCFKLYYCKGDPNTHLQAFNSTCKDYSYDDKDMANLFPHNLKDYSIQWLYY